MAVSSIRLDGQTLGFTTTGAETVDILTLNMSTGVVTSAYLTSVDILNLKTAVDALFALIPAGAARNAAALQMLQRLVTAAPANAASLSQSAVGGPPAYTLRITTSAAAYFIAHLPFSADGQLAWATGIDVVGTGTVTAVTASSPLASSGGATPNITITSPLPTLNGGTGIDGSASSGVFSVSSGTGGVTPLVYATATPGAEVVETIPVVLQLKNGAGNYTAEMVLWGQVIQGTLATITLAAGAAGQVVPMLDFATSGRFAMISDPAVGTVDLEVTDTTDEAVEIAYGPGPGTDQLFLGGTFEIVFDPP